MTEQGRRCLRRSHVEKDTQLKENPTGLYTVAEE